MINGLLQLLAFQALGELVSWYVVPSMPGPVIGLVLLLAFLLWKGSVPVAMDQVGSSILQHLGLLFVPASVGVVMFWPMLKANGLAVMVALLLSVMATVLVTALVLKWFCKGRSEDEHVT